MSLFFYQFSSAGDSCTGRQVLKKDLTRAKKNAGKNQLSRRIFPILSDE
jgi:hypothetical protein